MNSGRRPAQITLPRAQKRALPPEANPWFWRPNMPGVPAGPRWLQDKLDSVDQDLFVTENRYNGNLQIWLKTNRNQLGYTFLFPVPPAQVGDGTLIIARLYEASARKWGNGKQYMDAVIREQERQKEKAEAADLQDTMDRSMDWFHYSQIKNIGKGSKFSTYLS